ncbi:MAG: hypothetical protein UU21_C0011G0025 [Candidatus Levybacteria bacterium GW2011_GWA2_40_8]|nr:MAG: hypothetical protein UU21_C0011G0025 [Candidatus Levybacteria bacterium GW2011_GWA2_40_8]
MSVQDRRPGGGAGPTDAQFKTIEELAWNERRERRTVLIRPLVDRVFEAYFPNVRARRAKKKPFNIDVNLSPNTTDVKQELKLVYGAKVDGTLGSGFTYDMRSGDDIAHMAIEYDENGESRANVYVRIGGKLLATFSDREEDEQLESAMTSTAKVLEDAEIIPPLIPQHRRIKAIIEIRGELPEPS